MDTPPISLWVQLKKSLLIDPLTFVLFFPGKSFILKVPLLTFSFFSGHERTDNQSQCQRPQQRQCTTQIPAGNYIKFSVSDLNRHGSRWTWGNLLFDLFSRFQHWSRTVFCRPWQPEGTSLILQVRQTYSDATSPLSHILFPQESLSVS